MRVALVNTNRIKPPIAPIGLEYVAEALNAAGHHVQGLDLCWADEWRTVVARFFNETSFGLVGVTLRNTDDCAFTSRQSFLGEFVDVVNTIRKYTDAVMVLGGVGFSVMPEQILDLCGADAGVWGEGEFALVELANRVEGKREWRDGSTGLTKVLPNLIWRGDDGLHRNPPATPSLTSLPPMSRRWVDKLKKGLVGGDDPLEPLFFIEPEVAPFAFDLLDGLIGDDRRFFFFDPSRPDRNYNYNANQRLVDAIKEGYRGAYWDILRKYE